MDRWKGLLGKRSHLGYRSVIGVVIALNFWFVGFAKAIAVASDSIVTKPLQVVQPFQLKSVSGEFVGMSTFPEAKGMIVVFTCNHCPFAKAQKSEGCQYLEHRLFYSYSIKLNDEPNLLSKVYAFSSCPAPKNSFCHTFQNVNLLVVGISFSIHSHGAVQGDGFGKSG